jgi:hypothetical protein
VGRDGLRPFAVLLIEAVGTLHTRPDFWHCDIKPGILAWNASAKTASLVDFGHAQEEGATVEWQRPSARADASGVGAGCPRIQRRGQQCPRQPDDVDPMANIIVIKLSLLPRIVRRRSHLLRFRRTRYL